MSRRTLLAASAIACAATLSFAPARAARADSLVIESWVGAPSTQEKQWINALREGVADSGFLLAASTIIRALGPRLPLPALDGVPGQVDLMERLAASRVTLSQAAALYRGLRFEAAAQLLTELLAEVQRNPLIFASENGRPICCDALAYLALSQHRIRQSAAANTTAEELVRICPGAAQKIFFGFGPMADKLYRAAEARLGAKGKGTLLIEVSSPDTRIIVNAGPSTGRIFQADVLPGVHHVLITTPGQGARRYDVQVLPKQTARLVVDWQVDRALTFSEDSVSFVFEDDRARGSEGAVAVTLARTLNAGPRVIVIGTRAYNGRRAASASLYDVATGRHTATALAVMDGKLEDAKLAALKAFFLSGGRAQNPHLIVSDAPFAIAATAPPTPPAPPASTAPDPAITYLVGGAAVAAFGGGVAVVQLGDHASSATAPVAYGFFGASVALASYAAYRWALGASHSSPPRSSLSAAISPSPRGAVGWLRWGF